MPGLSATLRRPVWLLDYDVGGRVYRYASEAVEVTANLPSTRLGSIVNLDTSASAPKRSPNRGAP